MDIARTPATPDGNPEMADAAVQPQDPPNILRKDYTPFGWLVPEIALDFGLGLERTTVRTTMRVERNPAAEPTPTLRLNGDGIEPVEILSLIHI